MKKFLNEFKDFALRGNVLNLAVGVIIGAAFQNIVTSLTTNIINPIIGVFTGEDFGQWQITFFGRVNIKYGAFLSSIINFIIMAFVVFLIVKLVSKVMSLGKKPKEEEAPKTQKCPFCMTEIDINATRCPACTSLLKSKLSPPREFD